MSDKHATALSDERIKFLRDAVHSASGSEYWGNVDVALTELLERREAERAAKPQEQARYASGEPPAVGDVIDLHTNIHDVSIVEAVYHNATIDTRSLQTNERYYSQLPSGYRLCQRGPVVLGRADVRKMAMAFEAFSRNGLSTLEACVIDGLRSVGIRVGE